jgi:FkbM family methyltransferase
MIRRLQGVLRYLEKYGVARGMGLVLRKRKKCGTIELRVPNVKHPLHLRAGTSDLYMFEEVFLDGEYELETTLEPKLILDVGANAGFASVYFANRFPDARILAVEPDPSNVATLRRNVALYRNVEVIEGAVWWESTTLSLDDQGDKSGIQVRPGDGGVRAMTIDEILAHAGATHIDILKLDVEGAEKELFEHDPALVSKVSILLIELHDRFKPGCSRAVFSALAPHDFREMRHQTANWFVRG